ncbi:TolC family protein [Massilia niastensis]|uniref:TolC family protein n=1 Tax=Massilia niastensis TaxID=544911 RepID=UPI00039CA5FB|nr:TolC family protein [Massilia niastensis]
MPSIDELTQEAALDAAALAVAANTASGYLNLLGLHAQLALAKATLASRERSFALARHQFEVGYGSQLEMAQAEAELRATAGAIPQLERAIAQQEQALNLLAGASPGPVARGTGLAALHMPDTAPGLPSELLRRRPGIAQAGRAVAASDASLARLLRSPVELWSIGGSALAPMLDGGCLRAQAGIAATVRDRAVFTYENVVRGAFSETENALAGIDTLTRQLVEADGGRRRGAAGGA